MDLLNCGAQRSGVGIQDAHLSGMSSNRVSRIVPILSALACAFSLPDQARDKLVPGEDVELGRTLKALERYRILAAEDDGGMLPETESPIDPGQHYDGIVRLTDLLRRVGDLTEDADLNDSGLYEGALVSAVKRFQSRHGLDPDGRIDKATLKQLNTPLGFRVRQLELAVVRWRRRPYDSSRPAIILNLPEFRLRAFRANHVDLEMKIVVGQAPDRETPLLSSQLETVIFRPYWNVPLSIQRDELVPEIMKDHSFLPDNHIEVINASGIVQRAGSGDMLAQLRAGKLRLRQAPGPKNVLGLAKFVFPNRHEVYMHATSAQWLFARARRDLSHGCIRIEQPEELAEWVLRDESGWSYDRIVEAMQGSEPVTVKLHNPIQIVTMYVTAVALENGEVHFLEDIYGDDEALEKELAGAAVAPSSDR